VAIVLGKKKISRRKPGEKTFKNYFDDDTQNAIVAYQTEQDPKQREKLYVDIILPAFDKLIENLIHVYGFHVMYESSTDLKNECLEFLLDVIRKFNAEKGSKAFSYFNVVAKNWLTVESKKNAKRLTSYVSLDNREGLAKHDLDIIESYDVIPSIEDILTTEEFSKNLKLIVGELGQRAKTENEISCVNAINDILSNIDEIDLLSKRAVMCYIREITGMSSKQLSIVLSSLKKQYKIVKEEIITDSLK
jgi:hypothetical protein